MGRSKQSARKFNGSTPMSQQAACTSSATFRHYMVSQQAPGLPSAARGTRGPQTVSQIFINSENTFSNFSFHRPTTSEEFLPVVQVGKVRNFSEADQEPALFMRLEFLSRFDGRSDLLSESRQGIDAVFVLDVSGSMSLAFPDDSDRRSKLEVAKDAIRNVFSKLSARDRVALVTFNTSAKTILSLTTVSDGCRGSFESYFENIHANGGTNLTAGLAQGFHHLSSPTARPPSIFERAASDEKRLKRVFFLTDMESTTTDEVELVAVAQRHASSSCYFTVVGIGVDLSAATVERVSAVPGSRYMSVVNSREIDKVLVDDFEFDLAPIASDIRLTLPESCGVSFKKCFGSSELSSCPSRNRTIGISSEFPMSLASSETALGGLYLFQLELEQAVVASPFSLEVSWKDRVGNQQQLSLAVSDLIQPLLPLTPLEVQNDTAMTEHGLVLEINNASPLCDIGIRKACALVRYVETLTAYITKNDAPPIPHTVSSPVIEVDALLTPFQRQIQSRQARPVFPHAVPQATAVPFIPTAHPVVLQSPYTINEMVLQLHQDSSGSRLNDIGAPGYVTSRLKNVHRFRILRAYLLSELAMCGDMSLMAEVGAEYCNRNVLETIDQILSVEEKDLAEVINVWRSSCTPLHPSSALQGSVVSEATANAAATPPQAPLVEPLPPLPPFAPGWK